MFHKIKARAYSTLVASMKKSTKNWRMSRMKRKKRSLITMFKKMRVSK